MPDMENGDDKDATAPSPAVQYWTVGLTCVAIVATAYLIVGLLRKPLWDNAVVLPVSDEGRFD